MAAVISSVMSTKDKVPFFVNRCEEMGIEVLPPDVNISDHGFVVSGNKIRFGLDAVKNVGYSAVEAILKAREERPFESLWDFCERVDARAVNKRAVECLIKCGGLDSTGASRKAMLAVLPSAQSAGQKAQEDAQRGQASIFALDENTAGAGLRSQHAPILGEEFEQRELLAMEKETMGTFLSDHPLSQVREALRVRADCTLAELEKKADGATVTVGGIVAEAKKIRTKTGSTMMFATLDDLEGRVEMIIFAKTLEANGDLIDTDAVLLVRGRVDRKDRGEIKLVVNDAEPFEPTSAEVETAKEKVLELDKPRCFSLQLDAADYDHSIIEELKSVFASFPGDADVVLEMKTCEGVRKLRFGTAYRVDASVGLRAEIEDLLGQPPIAA
jgi:DNA polymerase-3 subunit alpha